MSSPRPDAAQVVRAVSLRLNIPEDMVRVLLDAYHDAILSELARGQDVRIQSFATFRLQERKPRTLKHPQTRRLLVVPAKRTVRILPSRAFQARAARKLETVVGVFPSGTGVVKGVLDRLEQAAYTTLAAPSLEMARATLEEKPVTAALVDGSFPLDAVHAFTRAVRESRRSGLCSVWVLQTEGATVAEAPFRVMPNRFLPASEPPDAVAKALEEEIRQRSEERGAFQQSVRMEMESSSEAVQEAIQFLEERLLRTSLPEEERLKFGAALRESLENGLRHGNKRDAGKKLTAEFLVDLEKVTFWVEDEGPGFDFEAFLQALPEGSAVEIARANLAGGKIGGLGMKLLRECADEVLYVPPGNRVVLTKYLPPAS